MDLKTRVVNILTKPREEWPAIASEQTDTGTLFKSYIFLLAAIPAVCGFIGLTVVGISVPLLGSIRIGVGAGLSSAVVRYVLTLVGTYVAAVIVEKLAPSFQSQGNTVQALKLVAYASTPAWLAGVFTLIPLLGVLAILGGLYGVYLFYVGVTPVMQTPPDKVIPYMVVSAIVVIVISVVVGSIAAAVTGPLARF